MSMLAAAIPITATNRKIRDIVKYAPSSALLVADRGAPRSFYLYWRAWVPLDVGKAGGDRTYFCSVGWWIIRAHSDVARRWPFPGGTAGGGGRWPALGYGHGVLAKPQVVGVFTGHHALAELVGVAPELLDDEAFLRELLAAAAAECGATVCQVISQRFRPQGVTVLALLSESHASLHSYPENGSVFVDVFTCGDRADPRLAVAALARALRPAAVHSSVVCRGRPPASARGEHGVSTA